MICNVNIDQEENKRTVRISTYISKETSDLLDEIVIKIKKTEKRKPKINEILERAIEKLYEDIKTP
jgi:predicted nucleotide-binding protein (sugar kinase/HSP70/actin superfamily)